MRCVDIYKKATPIFTIWVDLLQQYFRIRFAYLVEKNYIQFDLYVLLLPIYFQFYE